MSVNIRIIGKGCFFCNELRKIVDDLVTDMKVSDATVSQVHEVDELLEYGVVNPPALVINGKLKMMGRVLVKSRVKKALEEELAAVAEADNNGETGESK
ncbi:MAG: thioredoxin family protein [Candidatus Eisenbacteria bacterium]|nr:thioredoxin family protein [Candidatus Eisenbacteria bacterium]